MAGDDTPACCQHCGSRKVKAGVCLTCGQCQECHRHTDSCQCVPVAYDRYLEEQYREWEALRYR